MCVRNLFHSAQEPRFASKVKSPLQEREQWRGVRPQKIPLALGPYEPLITYRILKFVVGYFRLDSKLLTECIFWISVTRSGSECYGDNSGATIGVYADGSRL
jgi:hypothetical protein